MSRRSSLQAVRALPSGASGAGFPWLAPDPIALACRGEVLRRGGPALGVSTDTRLLLPGQLFVALRGERSDGHAHLAEAFAKGAAGAVVDRQVDLPGGLPGSGRFLVMVPCTGRALLDLARLHRRSIPASVIGITGSCGKTSTKDMLVHVLSRRFKTVGSPRSYNNALGVPLTLFLAGPDTEVVVVEMGSSGFGEIRELAGAAGPDGAVVTNVFESHLEGLGSLEGVAREKSAIFEGLPPGGFAVLNADNPMTASMGDRVPAEARCVRVSVEGTGDLVATDVCFNGLGTSFLVEGGIQVTIPRLGSHNVANALCALAVARELGLSLAEAVEGLADLPATERRLEPRRCGRVLVYDDSYNMNPGSARAALRALRGLPGSGRRVVVFGDMLELGERAEELHREVGCQVAELGFDFLVAVGDFGAQTASGAVACGMDPSRVLVAPHRGAALDALLSLLAPGDRVLVKASRRLELDLLVEALEARLGKDAGPSGKRREEACGA